MILVTLMRINMNTQGANRVAVSVPHLVGGKMVQ
jgi:hypothetical protein